MDMFEKEAVVQASILPIMLLLGVIAALVGPFMFNKLEVSTPTEISVLDNEFQIIHKIRDKNKIASSWDIIKNSKQINIPQKTDWTHKLDITGSRIAGRWLYNSKDGLISKLNKKLEPTLEIMDKDKFNEILLDF